MAKKEINKKLSTDELISVIRKDYGEGSIKKYNVDDLRTLPRTTTGILPVDLILGGGVPDGRIVEIYGPESSGKTTVTLHMIAAAQKLGKQCAFIDAEHAYDPIYAANIGVDHDKLLLSMPEYGEQALDITEALVNSKSVDLIIIDSVAALVPKKELEGDFGDSNVGLHARLMSQAMRKLTGPASLNNCTIVFINQIREKVGVMFGNPETTTGGRALKFYSSIRLDVRKIGQIKDKDKVVANRVRVKSVKNKTYPPNKQIEFDVIYGRGADNTGAVLDLGVDFALVNKGGGGYYTYKDKRIRGREATISFLKSKEGAELFENLEQEVRDIVANNENEVLNISPEELDATKKEHSEDADLHSATAYETDNKQ